MSEQREPVEATAADHAPAPVEETSGGLPEEEGPDGIVPILEALLFAAGDPVSLGEMQEALPSNERGAVESALARLQAAYGSSHGIQVVQVAGGYRMVTRGAYDRYIRALLRQRNRHHLGRASLETLAIVAYRQPVTGPEISEIRGKDSTGVLKGLLDKQLIQITGRKKVVGKPFLYGTTKSFLVHFGLNSLDDLPEMAEFEEMLQARVALLEEIPLTESEPMGDVDAVGDPETDAGRPEAGSNGDSRESEE